MAWSQLPSQDSHHDDVTDHSDQGLCYLSAFFLDCLFLRHIISINVLCYAYFTGSPQNKVHSLKWYPGSFIMGVPAFRVVSVLSATYLCCCYSGSCVPKISNTFHDSVPLHMLCSDSGGPPLRPFLIGKLLSMFQCCDI